jgi:short-subunit dehydrogenase
MATETPAKPRRKAKPAAPETEAPSRKKALVTGGSSGIGAEFARQLARKGYDVVITARRKDRLDTIAAEIRARDADVEVIEADLGSPEGAAAVQARIGRGDIDMLVNNAGFGINGVFGETALERELEELDVNVRALTQLSHAAIGHMKERGRGTIINVASTGAYQPVPYMATYAATKAYVLFFSEALHEEAKDYGVTVTCLCPGGTRTEFQQVAGVRQESLPRGGWMTPEPVVQAALEAAESGSAVVVPGLVNKTIVNLPRVAPRFLIRRVAGRMFKHN